MKLAKLLILFFILFVLLGAVFVFIFEKKATKVIDQRTIPVTSNTEKNLNITPIPPPGVLSLLSAQRNLKIGQKATVVVSMQANGKSVVGSDVILRYDPALLKVEMPIVESKFFSIYPRKIVDNIKGLVSITAFRATDPSPLNGTRDIATLTFTALKEGTSDISFDFVPFTTNHSTIVENRTSKNILGMVVPITLTIVK